MEKEEEDPFARSIPDDILIIIFTKVLDFKVLSQCFLVSRRFASAIVRIPAVSITLNSSTPEYCSTCLCDQTIETWENKWTAQIDSRRKNSINYFLNKFVQLRSVEVVFPFTNEERVIGHDDDEQPYKGFYHWKANVGSEFYTSVFLVSNNLRRIRGEELDGIDFSYWDQEFVRLMYRKFLAESVFRRDLLVMLIRDHPNLQNVAISNADGTKRFCPNGDELVRLGILTKKNSRLDIVTRKWKTEVGLILPVSGYVMDSVILLIVRYGSGKEPENYDDVVAWDYGEDEKVFAEALASMLMNQP